MLSIKSTFRTYTHYTEDGSSNEIAYRMCCKMFTNDYLLVCLNITRANINAYDGIVIISPFHNGNAPQNMKSIFRGCEKQIDKRNTCVPCQNKSAKS